MKSISLIFISILLILFSSCSSKIKGTESKASDDRGYLVKVGDKAPKFSIELIDGRLLKKKDFKGKVTMLQFTASWCKVCREEMPHIEKDIWQKHKDNPNFVLIGVDRDEPLEKVKQFKKSTGVTYPLGLDPDANIFALFANKKSGVTRNVIIDQEGNIAFLTRLFKEEEYTEMKAHIDELLKQ